MSARNDYLTAATAWRQALSLDPAHSTHQQITRLIWNMRVFRLINECRRLAEPSEDGNGFKQHGPINHLLDRCYVEATAIGIRRLNDGSALRGARGSYSLRNVLEDMLAKCPFITRSNVVFGWMISGGRENQARAAEAYFTARDDDPISLDLDVAESTSWQLGNRDFDKLCGRDEASRSLFDQLPVDWIECRLNRLAMCSNRACSFADKYVAHAANDESREHIKPITLGDLWDPLKAIAAIQNEVTALLFGHSSHWNIIYTDLITKHLDEPFARTKDIRELEDAWEQSGEETSTWGRSDA